MNDQPKTANEPIEGTDPGGTKPTRPGGDTPEETRRSQPPVESGDQNANPTRP